MENTITEQLLPCSILRVGCIFFSNEPTASAICPDVNR